MLSGLNSEMHSAGLYFQQDIKDTIGYTSYADLPDDCLMVLAAFDLQYYHQLELCFHQSIAHNINHEGSWPDHWEKPQLELLSDAGKQHAMQQLQLTDDNLFVFAFNVGSFGDNQYYIAARGFSVYQGTVFYYNRSAQDTLKDNERIAWWVSR